MSFCSKSTFPCPRARSRHTQNTHIQTVSSMLPSHFPTKQTVSAQFFCSLWFSFNTVSAQFPRSFPRVGLAVPKRFIAHCFDLFSCLRYLHIVCSANKWTSSSKVWWRRGGHYWMLCLETPRKPQPTNQKHFQNFGKEGWTFGCCAWKTSANPNQPTKNTFKIPVRKVGFLDVVLGKP